VPQSDKPVTPAPKDAAAAITEAEAADLISRGAYLLDVRTRMGSMFGVIPGARWMPLARLWECFHELPPDKPILTYCRTARRAGKATLELEDVGFHAVNGGRFKTIAKLVKANAASAAALPR
jgi:rhodanese-related sulfurtransferase